MTSISVKTVVVSLLLPLAGFGVYRMLAQSGTPADGKAREAIAILKDPARTAEERGKAAQTLFSLGSEIKSIEPALLEILQGDSPFSKEFDENPQQAMERPDFLLYSTALNLLGRLVPAPESVPVLTELLRRQEDPLLQFQAGYALGNLGAEARSAVPALIHMLRSGSDSDQAEIATFTLARIAPDPAVEAAIPVLIETMRGGKGWTGQLNAAVALLKLGREEGASRAVIHDEARLGPFLPLLAGENPLHRLHVCEALMFFGPPQRDFLDLLRGRAAEDSDPRVRAAAAKALQKVAADVHASVSTDRAGRALPTLPPELAEAGEALLEISRALETGDVETYKKHLGRESRKEFERDPKVSFFAAQSQEILPALRLMGGTVEGSTATIDFFSRSGGTYSHGTITMAKEGGQWVKRSMSDHAAQDVPGIEDSTPLGQNERAALDVLQEIGAAQIDHWNRSKPPSYADSLAKMLGRGADAEILSGQKAGYVFTMAAGARSNGVYHAWFAEAHPVRYKETGVRSYYIDERGIILQSDTRGKPLLIEMPER